MKPIGNSNDCIRQQWKLFVLRGNNSTKSRGFVQVWVNIVAFLDSGGRNQSDTKNGKPQVATVFKSEVSIPQPFPDTTLTAS